MRKAYKKNQIEELKKSIQAKYNNYDSLLDWSANLLLKLDDAEKVMNILSVNDVAPKTKDASVITVSQFKLELLADLDNDYAADAITEIHPNLEKGRKFKSGKYEGSIGEPQKYINELVAANPEKTAKELERLADKNIIGKDAKSSTFANKVTIARKLL